jgi:hypothetical protein
MKQHLDAEAREAAQELPCMPLLLTEEQAAALLSISPRKLWELAAGGFIPVIKIDSIKRYRRMDLEAWVEKGCPMVRE